MGFLQGLFGKKSSGDDGRGELAGVKALLSRGDIGAAMDELREQLPDPEAGALLREILVGERRNEEAAEVARQLVDADHPEALVSRAFLAQLSGNLQEAVELCQQALAESPGLATANNHLGRALFNAGQATDAHVAFAQATRRRPDYAEAWHNLGHVQRALGRIDDATTSFRKALKHSPGYRQARLNLGITLFNNDAPIEALECFRALAERNPDDVDAQLNAGLCLQALAHFADAREAFEKVVDVDPENSQALFYLGILNAEQGQTNKALAALHEAARLDPDNIETWIEIGAVHELANQVDEAAAALAKAEALDPHFPPLQMELAKLDRRRKDPAAAARRLRAIDPAGLPPRQEQRYFYELGFALDRIDESDAAFQAFTEANHISRFSARRQMVDENAFPQDCERMEKWYARGAPGAQPRPEEETGDLGEDLCFLIGFPRSGTTLLDTTLNAHPDVTSIEERPTLEPVIAQIDGYPNHLDQLRLPEIEAMRAAYRENAAHWLPENPGRLICDKLPLRGLHAGFIRRLFPKAKLLFSLRHPCDVVLSNFMQDYEANEAFVHFDSIEESAETYDMAMRAWEAAEDNLDLGVHYLRYEELVADPEGTLKAACAFMGIAWQESMLDVESRMKQRKLVRTNSYQQVAESLYTRASGRWPKYLRYIESSLPLLAPHAERYGYSLETGQD